MFPRATAWPRAILRVIRQPKTSAPRRAQSSNTSKPNPSPDDRASRIIDRLPRRLQPYASSLRRAPVSHVVAFLILHEITAIVPLLALFSLFHYTSYTPTGLASSAAGYWGGDIGETSAKFARYFAKKGWFGLGEDAQAIDATGDEAAGQGRTSAGGSTSNGRRDASPSAYDTVGEPEAYEGQYKVVTEVAVAWLITKGLLPARILLSVWATPWFAGIMLRARSVFRTP
ncbi:hypothetical protein F5X68DRAFT_259413 [Plectosphaerella plurivora]|uniref:Uncharacterized protein n=1 Tax=Plectosphaerella plurivora TaxID=936078 RepID=A0A9P8VG12_9PEZI|nr:hypothetical protein F5X68DRAFT_259413 [Plectosphaerella plurivora]